MHWLDGLPGFMCNGWFGQQLTTPMRRMLPSAATLILSADWPGMSALIWDKHTG